MKMDVRKIAWPCELSAATKQALIRHARPLLLDMQQHISIGSKGSNGLYYVTDGLAALGLERQAKTPPLVLIESGQWFGALLSFGHPELAYRITAVDYVRLLHIPDEVVRAMAAVNTELFKFLYFIDVRHIRETIDMLFATAGMDKSKRVAYLLLKIGERFSARDNAALPVIPLSQAALCKILGLSRPSLSQELKALQVVGLIRVERKRVSILDPAGLQQVATGTPV